MTEADIDVFTQTLSDMLGILSHGKYTPDAKQNSMWFRVLAPYPIEAVIAGMTAHMRSPSTGRTLPIPADIIEQINGAVADDGRPGADEAWAIAAQSADDGATVVWTPEIAEAWGIARHVMNLGDEVGARVAFRDAYNRIVTRARTERRPLAWQAALGTDRARQADALRIAAGLGRISRAEAAEFEALPAPRGALLLAAPVDESGAPSAAGIAALRAVRNAMGSKTYTPSADAAAKLETTARQEASAEQVAAYVRNRDAQA